MRNLYKLNLLPSAARTRHVLFCLLLNGGLSMAFGQTTYYVASSGNDANDGRSAGSPVQTLTKVSSLNLQPGDQVLFRRGDTFRGTLQINKSGSSGRPIIFDAYGSGDKPVLAGSAAVTGWNSIGGNVWQANCPTCGDRVTGLYRTNSALPLGRYPNADAVNKGYLTVQSHQGKTQLTSQQGLPANYTGGEAVYRPVQWILNRATISGQNGNTLSLNNPTGYDLTDNWGFFIQNHPATLDQAGEWCYNPATRTIRLYSDQGNPNDQGIAATVSNEAINLTNVNFVTIRNLSITQGLRTNLYVNNGSNLVLSGNDITNAGEDGVFIAGSGSNVLAENNAIADVNNNGFTIQSYQNLIFRGNTIRRVGLRAGRGKSDDGQYVGFQSYCTANTLIENNVLDNIGYNALNFSNNSVIQRNQISNFCMTKSDGSGLYIWNGNKQPMGNIRLASNMVWNGIAASEGTPSGSTLSANGIYLDDCTTNIEVTGNTVYNCRGLGFYLHGSSNIRLTDNTAFNNAEGQLAITDIPGACSPRNNLIQNNVFVSKMAGQFGVKYESNQNDLSSFGSFGSNVYARPFEDVFKVRAVFNTGSGIRGYDLSLAEWQSRFGSDQNTTNSPLTYRSYVVTGTGTTKLDNAFPNDGQGWGTWGPYGNGQAAWDNSGRLDGGSLRVSFPSASGRGDSYVIATNGIGSVSAGKSYRLQFDAVATSANKRVEAFLRQRDGSYRDLDARLILQVGTSRKSYETVFTPAADEANAIVVFQVTEDGQTVWFDNVRLQEVTRGSVNPDDYVRIVCNLTANTSQVSLDGNYRDARNNACNGQVSLAPFASAVLFKQTTETPGPAPTPAPAVALRNPENPASAVAGLDYSYYEGGWSALPNFDALAPVKTGTVNAPDLSIRRRDNEYGVRFKGYVNVPADGMYTFFTSSDDGSKLYIGDTEVVNNDNSHPEQERSGTIGLKAGRHAVTITFFQGGGGQALNVSYSGPNLNKQIIPASAYFRVSSNQYSAPAPAVGSSPGNGGNNGTGLRAEYFGNMTLSGSPVLTRTDATVNFDWGNGSPASGMNVDNFSVRWTGQVEAPVTGRYVFTTSSDDGVRLWVNGTQVINNWTDHAPTTDNGAVVELTGGRKYDIRLEYYENGGGATAKLLWSYPGQSQQVVPQGRLYPPVTTSSATTTATYLSDLSWTSMSNGYGAAERDRSNGENGDRDGRTMTVNQVTYAKGLGVHAPSEITYALNGRYQTFLTDIGLDDEIKGGNCGSAEFQVYLDGALVYRSGVMYPTTATKSVSLDVSGKQTLKLVVTNGGDNNDCDHADWAGARLISISNGRVAAPENQEFDSPLTTRVYPVPARDELNIRYVAEAAGEATLLLLNTAAQPVLQSVQPIVAGENVLKLPVRELSRGFYMLNLIQGQQRITRKVILSE